MKKKTFGRIAALSIAALTAVPTFSIVASAEVSVTSAWRIPVSKDEYGNFTYAYYNSKNEADAANLYTDSATGNKIAPVSVTSIPNIKVGDAIHIDSSGKILPGAATAGTIAGKWGGSSSSGSSTGSGIFNTAYHYAEPQTYYSSTTQRYYPNLAALRADVGDSNAGWSYGPQSTYNSTNQYFDYTTGIYVSAPSSTTIHITRTGTGYSNQYVVPSGYRYASTVSYYSPETATWYPNLEALRAAVGYNTTNYTTKTPSTAYSTTNHYFNPTTGNYVSTTSGNPYAVAVSAGSTTGRYTVYYSSYTGKYYDTLAAANAATPSGYTVRTITNSAYTASYLNTYGYGYNGYYNGFYNGYYDPNYYYYYYLLGGNTGLGGTSTTTKDTSTVTIGNLKGWTNVARTITAAKAGSSYTVNMKTETEIPETVLKALKGKNVTISFKLSNGAVFTLNGNDITSTTAISPTVRYGSTSIPSSLKKKAVKANSGVSSSQFTINGGSFGADASVTVKFNSKRAGCSAKLYRYNASENTLSLVSRSAVQSNGQCEFDNVKQGGEYLVVLS